MNENEQDFEDIEAEETFIMKHYPQDELMDLREWVRVSNHPGPFKPYPPHLPGFAPPQNRERANQKYMEDLQNWKDLWAKERGKRKRELEKITTLRTDDEWQALKYNLTREVQEILRDQDEKRIEKKKKQEEDLRLFRLIMPITKKHPFPAPTGKKEKNLMKKHSREDFELHTYCPVCGKKLYSLAYDAYGDLDLSKEFKPCMDVIGEVTRDYQGYSYNNIRKGFEVISDIITLYDDYYSNIDSKLRCINKMIEIDLVSAGEDIEEFLVELGINVETTSYNNGMIGGNGYVDSLFVHRDLQKTVSKKFQVILKRMLALKEVLEKDANKPASL
ncbi:MAG: hypothetical protein QUS13_02775 [Smithella sp.]|nr:hypothetical protein [Smithella sp.]